jgi:hypothetical protein
VVEPPLGGGRTTPLAQGGGSATLIQPVWGWLNHPMAQKKKKKKMGFGLLGVAGPPPWAMGVAEATPLGQWGGSATLAFFLFFFFFFFFCYF